MSGWRSHWRRWRYSVFPPTGTMGIRDGPQWRGQASSGTFVLSTGGLLLPILNRWEVQVFSFLHFLVFHLADFCSRVMFPGCVFRAPFRIRSLHAHRSVAPARETEFGIAEKIASHGIFDNGVAFARELTNKGEKKQPHNLRPLHKQRKVPWHVTSHHAHRCARLQHSRVSSVETVDGR